MKVNKRIVSIKDFGDTYADRYVITFADGDVYNLSHDADQPNGCCIYAGNINDDRMLDCGGKAITFNELPDGTKKQLKFIGGRIAGSN